VWLHGWRHLRDLRSLDFASPRAILVASIALKNLGSIFDEVESLVTAANPNALAQMDQMQQGLGINLKTICWPN
jgi:hypothetical protein